MKIDKDRDKLCQLLFAAQTVITDYMDMTSNYEAQKLVDEIETARRMGDQLSIEEKVDKAMNDANLNIEGKLQGRWVPIEDAPFEEKE